MKVDDGRKVGAGEAVEGPEGGAVPEAAKFGDSLCKLIEAAEKFHGAEAGSGGQFGEDIFVVGAVGRAGIEEPQ